MESLPNEIVLIVFSYLKTSDIVYAFYLLNRRYTRLIEEFRPFSRSIVLTHVSPLVFNLYHSLIFQSNHIERWQIERLQLECRMLDQLLCNIDDFPRLKSLSIIVRRNEELPILLKYFFLFKQMTNLFIRSDICCCDRLSFEENVKQNLFQTQIQSLTFATPPCYSISVQEMNFQQCLFTNLTLTVRSINDVCAILSNASHLQSLRIRVLDTNINPQNPLRMGTSPSRLEHFLFICLHSISYEIIRNIFRTLIPLKKLSFSLVFDIQSGMIDGHRLREDIFEHLPNLLEMKFEIKSLISMMSNDFIRSFNHPFWSRFAPIGFHSYNHLYTLPFPFHHLDLDQSILKRQQTRQTQGDWRLVRDLVLYDRLPYTKEFLLLLRDQFSRLTTLTLKWKFDLMQPNPPLSTWFSLPMIRRLTIKSTHLQNPERIKELCLSLPTCETLDCDYVLIARTTCYFRREHVLKEFGKRLRMLLVDELPSDWKNAKKKKKNIYFRRFRLFFPHIECPLYN